MTLKAETYALLAGALGLWVALAVIMYLTRRIDWYAQGGSLPND
jgi:inner membrane protein